MYKIVILCGILLLLQGLVVRADEADILFDDSEIPTIYVSISPDSLSWLLLPENRENDRYLRADFNYVSSTMDTNFYDIGFRLRGNTSRSSGKKSFKISMNAFESQNFYGLKKINMNGEHNDPTICRSKLGWDIFNEVGVPASRCSHVRLYINGYYRGLYVNVEEYNSTFLESHYGNSDGNLYKCTFPADLSWRGEDPELYKFENSSGRVYDLKTNTEEDDYSDLAHLIDIINNTADDEFSDSLETCFDTWNYLKVLATEVILGHWDNYWYNQNNYFLYHNPETGKFEYIPYDVDNTFGIWWDGIEGNRDWGIQNVYSWGNAFGEARPLVDRMMNLAHYRILYNVFLDGLRNDHFNSEILDTRILSLREQIGPAAEEDNYRTIDYGWNYQDFLNSFTGSIGQHVPYGLTDYVSTRTASIVLEPANWESNYALLPFAPTYYINPEGNSLELEIKVYNWGETADVELVVMEGESETSYEMSQSGIFNEGLVDLYQYVISYPLSGTGNEVHFYIRVPGRNGYETLWPRFAPADYLTARISGICINEFLASNDDTNEDEYGENDDWVELYNYFPDAIDLNGYYLTDNSGNPDKWAFPDTTIQPGEHLLVWTDDDEEQGPLHTSFKLSADGEFVGLVKEEEGGFVYLDSMSFGTQETDISWGRYPDAGSDFGQMIPSPGSTNTPLGVDEEMASIPSEMILYPPYPNPFNAEVAIRYELPLHQSAKLRIVNIEGKIVEEKVLAGAGGKGIYHWNAKKYSSGIYFTQLISGPNIKTAKIVLLK